MSHIENLSLPSDVTPQPVAGLVLLHGRHMRPDDLLPFVPALSVPVRCVVPPGPVAHEDGSRSWWPVDMRQREAELATGPVDLADRHPAGREAARAALSTVIDRLHASRPSGEPLILAGFSQGGMLALDYLLHTGDTRITGLALLSSSRIAADEWAPRMSRVSGLPVLVTHGRRDANLSFAAGLALRDDLIRGGADVRWLAFEGGHEVSLASWRGLRRFIQSFADH